MSVVSIVRLQDDDVEGAVKEAVSLTQSFESVEWEGSRVLIKPNVVKPVKSGSGVITDVRLIEAVTKLVVERGPKSVVIGEGSSVGYDFPGREDSIHCMEVAGALEGEPVRLFAASVHDTETGEAKVGG